MATNVLFNWGDACFTPVKSMGGAASVQTDKYVGVSVLEESFLTTDSAKDALTAAAVSRTTLSLSQIMTSSFLLKKLKFFVSSKWAPADAAGDAGLLEEGTSVALNFIDFCCDVGDFKKLPKCMFQYFQASYIYQTYIVHGAVKRIPMSICISDDITDKLSCRHDDQDPQIFSPALGEAVEFLATEVFPAYSATNASLGVADQKEEMAHLLHAGARRSSLFQTPDHPLCNAIMLKLLQDAKYMSSFKAFMMEIGAENVLFAFNNLQDIYEYLSVLNVSADVSDEMRVLNYLELVHSFYKNYMSTGSEYKIPLSAATVSDFLHITSQTVKVDCEVLRPVEENIHQLIIQCYLDPYLDSPHFRQMERMGRQSVALMAEQLTKPSIESSDNLSEMKRFLRSEFDGVFANFLDERGQLPYLYFYQSASRFKEGMFEFDMDRIVQSSYIIDRYIARNAPTQISIPEFVRLRVLKNRFQSPQDMFIEAADWVLHYLCTYYWVKFQEEMAKVPHDADSHASSGRINTPKFDKSVCTGPRLLLKHQKSVPVLIKGKKSDENAAECTAAKLSAAEASELSQLQGDTPGKYSLHDILQDPKCCGIFKESLDREGTSQTLLFLMEVEEYRRIPMADYMSRSARKIYNKFIHPQCIMPIPITGKTRDTITAAIEGSSYAQTMFTEAFSEVCSYLAAHQFARFLVSVEYLRVAKILSQDSGMEPEKRKLFRRGSIQLCPVASTNVSSFRDIIGSQACTRFFKEYCARLYCAENLFFWMDAENYSNVPGNDYRRSTAMRIFRKYISTEAKQQINISDAILREISNGLHIADKNLFKKAQAEVCRMLEGDVIPKFLLSEEYQLMVQFVAGSGVAPAAAKGVVPLMQRLSKICKSVQPDGAT